MDEFLKGNYQLPKRGKVERTPTREDPLEQEFYRKALEKLGGSIAFIMKSKNLLWKGDQAPS